MISPKKKKIKLMAFTPVDLKRENEYEESKPNKRLKVETTGEDTSMSDKLQSLKRKNFVSACQQVSYKAYFDYQTRLQLVYLPKCMRGITCNHHKNATNIKVMPPFAEESFKIEIKANMWCEALEVCQMCLTSNQYLSENVLRDIVEIILNAHEDEHAGYTINYLIGKCQQILAQNFSTHPPCVMKTIRTCYLNFLTAPMDSKDNTFTNRAIFGCDKGLVKYCMNRVEYEISKESADGPLVDRCENVPEEMKETVRGLHWQKEKFEIFESLERPERIKRLMAVLSSIIELLQFDLGIWHSRFTNNLGLHIMRSHKPLMAYILWSNDVLCTGAVNTNCRQILKLFVYLVHLKYPEEHIKVFIAWLNTMIQTFYSCETNSNSDFPNIGKYSMAFAKAFYNIIAELPPTSMLHVIENIQPSYMRYLVGSLHINSILMTRETDLLKNMIDFVRTSKWDSLSDGTGEINLSKRYTWKKRKVKNILYYLSKKCLNLRPELDLDKNAYSKLDLPPVGTRKVTQSYKIHIFYITLEAYLDAYNVHEVQETLDKLNEKIMLLNNIDDFDLVMQFYSPFSVTENFIKKYRTIFLALKELMLVLSEMKKSNKLPKSFKIFENIGL